MGREISGDTDLSQTAIADLGDLADTLSIDLTAFWSAVARFLTTIKPADDYTVQEVGWIDDAIDASGSSLTFGDLVDTDDTPNIINGTSGNDTLNGTAAMMQSLPTRRRYRDWRGRGRHDYGNDGHDNMDGGSGHDTLTGGNGNDTLAGGTGGNFLYGDAGDDTYVYGGGTDVISDSGGTDIITLPQGVTPADVTFSRVGDYDLLIGIEDVGTIQIQRSSTRIPPTTSRPSISTRPATARSP